MGNCQQQFINVPQPQGQLKYHDQRLDLSSISVINKTHMKIIPQNSQQIKIGAIKQDYINRELDQQRLYDTRLLNTSNLVKIKQTKKEALKIQEDGVVQELDFNFYRQLGLPQYSYKEIPVEQQMNFKNLQINQNTDRYGVKYIGQWNNNQIHGNGVLTSNTKKYIGQFKNGLKHFHGRQIQKNQVYQGQFQFGRRKGNGIRYTPLKVQMGTFDNVLTSGKINYTNGSYFKGTLLNNQFHGPNCQYYDQKTKVRYQGEFNHDKMTGFGVLQYPMGKRYKGQLLQGNKHGKGQFYWDQNTSYKGDYKNDQKHGNGILRMDGKIFEGTFKNGMLDGQVIVTQGRHASKRIYYEGKQINADQQSICQDLPQHWQ